MTHDDLDGLGWLARWYADHCDGDWEHSYGIEIGTLDNPGWTLKIDLRDTALKDRPFDTVAFNMDAPDGDPAARWHHCKVVDYRFEGAGGVHDLSTLVGVFRAWVAETGS